MSVATTVRWSALAHGAWLPRTDHDSRSRWPDSKLHSLLTPHDEPGHTPQPGDTVQFAGVRWYGKGLFVREERTSDQILGRCYLLRGGNLVYNRLFGWKQAFAVVPPNFTTVAVSAEFPQFRADTTHTTPEFIALVCATPSFAARALERSTGSTAVSRNRLLEADFLSLSIPLPPKADQRNILAAYNARHKEADRLEQQANHEAEAAWAAFTDALVHQVDIRSAALTETVPFSHLDRWDTANTSDGMRFKMPTINLDRIADIRLGSQVPRANAAAQVRGGTPYLASRNVRRGHVTLDDIRVMRVPDQVTERLRLQRDDLLFVEGSGSITEVGRCARWHEPLPLCIHQNSVVRARITDPKFSPAFIEAWFNSIPGNGYIREQATTTSGLYHIGSGKLGRAPVPAPNLQAQQRLVERLEKHLRSTNSKRARAEHLRDSALHELELAVFGRTEEPELTSADDAAEDGEE